MHADRGDVRCVDSPDHDVLVAARGFHNEMADERGSDAPPVRRFVHKNGMFDGERITGPRPEIAKARETHDSRIVGNDHGKMVRTPRGEPGPAVIQRGRRLRVDRVRASDDMVVDRKNIRQIILGRLADLH